MAAMPSNTYDTCPYSPPRTTRMPYSFCCMPSAPPAVRAGPRPPLRCCCCCRRIGPLSGTVSCTMTLLYGTPCCTSWLVMDRMLLQVAVPSRKTLMVHTTWARAAFGCLPVGHGKCRTVHVRIANRRDAAVRTTFH